MASTASTTRLSLRIPEGRTADEQAAWGRAVRAEVPRRTLARTEGLRARDAVELTLAEEDGLVEDLLPIRHARMAASPFAFLRGSAGLMARDLSSAPTSGIGVQLCGDSHVSNFGLYATPERHLVFDVNDFDETHAGPFEWDVLRLAASASVAARGSGFGADVELVAARAGASAYREAMRAAASERFLEVWYSQIDADSLFATIARQLRKKGDQARLKASQRALAKEAAKRTALGSLDKLAEETPDGWRIRERPPLIVRHPRTEEIDEQLRRLFEQYAASLQRDHHVLLGHYRLVDFARKVVGVGSVGTEAFAFLLMGTHPRDPLFLQLKEARASVFADYVDGGSVVGTSPVEHEGERVVTGQRLMQAASDAFLGWASGGRDGAQHFYFRQLRDMKVSAEVELMSASELVTYTELCARTLARAHARSGSATAIAAYLGSSSAFDDTVASWAVAYTDQNDHDHAALVDAIRSGRIAVSENAV